MSSVTGPGREGVPQHIYNAGAPPKAGKTESNISRLTTGKIPIHYTSPKFLESSLTKFSGKGEQIESKTDPAGYISEKGNLEDFAKMIRESQDKLA